MVQTITLMFALSIYLEFGNEYVLKYPLVVKSRVGRPRPYMKLFKKFPNDIFNLTFIKHIPPYFDYLPSLLHLHFYSYLEQINDKHPVVTNLLNQLVTNILFILLFIVFVVKNFDISKVETQKCWVRLIRN